MKVFNPEKELKKIQHGNRNKILYSIILLLLIISIGSTYALYQVRYSKRIIYTKVAPFGNRDVILSVKVEGESSARKSFPSKDESLSYVGLECEEEGITNGAWNHETWSLILDTKGPNKCDVLFKKVTYFNEVIVANDITIFDDDPGGNIRYAGANPGNYIWFNCDNYDNLTQESASIQCEKWRIIGLFKNITKTIGGQEDLVKIIRSESVENMPWDSAGSNNWTKPASLQTSLIYYYNGTELSSAKGITKQTRPMIEQVTWNIGGTSNWNNSTAAQFYSAERVGSTWNGYIGLMYPSDYGYAAEESCWSTQLSNYYISCKDSDWLFNSTSQWTLTPYSSNGDSIIVVNGNGSIFDDNVWYPAYMTNPSSRPTLYLKSGIKIEDGNGSNEIPYILSYDEELN